MFHTARPARLARIRFAVSFPSRSQHGSRSPFLFLLPFFHDIRMRCNCTNVAPQPRLCARRRPFPLVSCTTPLRPCTALDPTRGSLHGKSNPLPASEGSSTARKARRHFLRKRACPRQGAGSDADNSPLSRLALSPFQKLDCHPQAFGRTRAGPLSQDRCAILQPGGGRARGTLVAASAPPAVPHGLDCQMRRSERRSAGASASRASVDSLLGFEEEDFAALTFSTIRLSLGTAPRPLIPRCALS